MGLGLGLGLYDSYWWDKSSCTKYSDDWIDDIKNIRAQKTIFDISYSIIALLVLTIRVFVYVISLNDDGFAYQRSAEGVVLYVQVKCHTFQPKIPLLICLSFII